MRTGLIVGNWKMNGSLSSAVELVTNIKSGYADETQLVICPPSVYLMKLGGMLADTKIALGGQNVCDQDAGAYTGEISAAMLRDCGCRYVIVGHSERRNLYQESDQLVAARFMMAKSAGLIPILCLGETLQQREQGITEDVVARQLDAVLDRCGIDGLTQAVIAYEPVWAIGTGKVATPAQAQAVHAFIRAKVAGMDVEIADGLQILYGGSMNSNNAAELLSQADIDGGLIGGASLQADDFLAVARSV